MISAFLRKELALAAKHKSLRQIARECHVPQPTLSRFLSGERDLYLKSVELLVEYLGLALVAHGKQESVPVSSGDTAGANKPRKSKQARKDR